MRVESERACEKGGWLHPREVAARTELPPREPEESDTDKNRRFCPLAVMYAKTFAEHAEDLGRTLGVDNRYAACLGAGWDGSAYTFPERSGSGLIVGISRRRPNGKKVCVPGSRRGLTYSPVWFANEGPIFIVEGASDVLAGMTLGLCVVGRPSNLGGIDYLAKLFAPLVNRKIIFVAERDEKDRTTLARHKEGCKCCNQCFPGKYGAIQSSIALSRKLERICLWSFLPGKAKDLRGWLNGTKADVNNQGAMARLRQSLRRLVKRPIH